MDHRQHGCGGEARAFAVRSDLPLSLDRACPAVGEHTREVLAELGFSSTDVEAMRRAGAVTIPPPLLT